MVVEVNEAKYMVVSKVSLILKWAKLCTTGEVSPCNSVWSQEVPSVFVWKRVPIADRPQTTHYHPGTQDRNSLISCCSTPTLGFDALEGYKYQIKYKHTKCHGNAEGLSRLPLQWDKLDDSISTSTILTFIKLKPCQWTPSKLLKPHTVTQFSRKCSTTSRP